MKKYQCPCCSYFTYNVPPAEDWGFICPVCFWENDPLIASNDDPSGSNHGITLNEAKYQKLLKEQLAWLNANYIQVKDKSYKLYTLYNKGKLPETMRERCCNFKLLEEKCLKYTIIDRSLHG